MDQSDLLQDERLFTWYMITVTPFLTGWHLEILGAEPVKKTTLYIVSLGNNPSEPDQHVYSEAAIKCKRESWMYFSPVEGKQEVTPPCLWLNSADLVIWEGWKLS